jgi:uncharacterized membrane protein YbhN (UPF0104 family)
MIRFGPRQAAVSAVALALTAALLVWFLGDPAVRARLGPAVAGADWPRLAAAVAVLATVQWLRAWRFNLLAFGRGRLPEWRLVRISAQLTALNFLLPFRLGEVGFPLLMKRAYGVTLMRGAGVLALARLMDLATVGTLTVALAALLIPAEVLPGPIPRGGLIGLAVLGAVVSATLPLLLRVAIRCAAGRLDADSLAGRLSHKLAATPGRGSGLGAAALGWAIWLTFGLGAWLAAGAVAGPIDLTLAQFGAAAGNLAFALPINGLVGLGPAQAAFVAATTAAGQPFAEAAIAALALHAAAVIAALGFGGVATAIPAAPAHPAGSPSTEQS